MLVEKRNLADLIASEYNPRKSTEKQEQDLRNSLKKFGCVEPIIINNHKGRENVIIGGHFRVKELIKLKQKTVDCIILDLDEKDEKELNIRLNANTGEWDFQKLLDEWDSQDLKDWGLDLENIEFDNENETEDIEDYTEDEYSIEVKNERNIEIGNIWQLGKHRLICGDATKKEDINKLMDGKLADIVFIDPPYNIDISVKNNTNNKRLKILNDNLEDGEFLKFLDTSFKNIKEHSKAKIHNYICCNMKCYSNFEKVVNQNWKNKISDIFIWIKDLKGLGFGYREQYEIIIFSSDVETVKFKNKCESNVWEYPKSSSFTFRSQEKDNIDKSINLLHPTIKPSFMIMRAIKNSSKQEQLILDTFGGSGSTLIACERSNRICYISELDPIFCNVVINRWEKLTGNKAKELIKNI